MNINFLSVQTENMLISRNENQLIKKRDEIYQGYSNTWGHKTTLNDAFRDAMDDIIIDTRTPLSTIRDRCSLIASSHGVGEIFCRVDQIFGEVFLFVARICTFVPKVILQTTTLYAFQNKTRFNFCEVNESKVEIPIKIKGSLFIPLSSNGKYALPQENKRMMTLSDLNQQEENDENLFETHFSKITFVLPKKPENRPILLEAFSESVLEFVEKARAFDLNANLLVRSVRVVVSALVVSIFEVLGDFFATVAYLKESVLEGYKAVRGRGKLEKSIVYLEEAVKFGGLTCLKGITLPLRIFVQSIIYLSKMKDFSSDTKEDFQNKIKEATFLHHRNTLSVGLL